jgi:hypothetical protein
MVNRSGDVPAKRGTGRIWSDPFEGRRTSSTRLQYRLHKEGRKFQNPSVTDQQVPLAAVHATPASIAVGMLEVIQIDISYDAL